MSHDRQSIDDLPSSPDACRTLADATWKLVFEREAAIGEFPPGLDVGSEGLGGLGRGAADWDHAGALGNGLILIGGRGFTDDRSDAIDNLLGVPLGTKRAVQRPRVISEKPCSCGLGTSGNPGQRLSEVTAIALTLPLRIISVAEIESNMICT